MGIELGYSSWFSGTKLFGKIMINQIEGASITDTLYDLCQYFADCCRGRVCDECCSHRPVNRFPCMSIIPGMYWLFSSPIIHYAIRKRGELLYLTVEIVLYCIDGLEIPSSVTARILVFALSLPLVCYSITLGNPRLYCLTCFQAFIINWPLTFLIETKINLYCIILVNNQDGVEITFLKVPSMKIPQKIRKLNILILII